MARSKSPRKRTPAKKSKKKAAAASADPLSNPMIQSAIVVAIFAVVQYIASGPPSNPKDFLGSLLNMMRNDVNIGKWPFGIVLTGHVMNVCRGASGEHWLGSVTKCIVAAYGGWMLTDVLNGEKSRLLSDESHVCLVALFWYFMNHNLPFTSVNVWNAFNDAIGPVGSIVNKYLGTCSLIFTTGQVISAASGASSTPGPFLPFSIYAPLTYAIAAGAHSQFYPLNKGVDLSKMTSAVFFAFAVTMHIVAFEGWFLGLDIPVIGQVYGAINNLVGGQIILGAVLCHNLFMDNCPWNPVRDFWAFHDKALNL